MSKGWIIGIAILVLLVFAGVFWLQTRDSDSQESELTISEPAAEAAEETVEEPAVEVTVSTPNPTQWAPLTDWEKTQIRQIFPPHIRAMEQGEYAGQLYFLDCSQYTRSNPQDVWIYAGRSTVDGPIVSGRQAEPHEAEPCPDGTG